MNGWRRTSYGLSLAVVLLLGATILAACSGPGEALPQGVNEGSRARDFSLPDLDGGEVSLSDYEGQVVLVNFWATWCGPCRAEIPDLEAAYRTHQDKGFVVLGVNIEESPETVRPFVDDLEVTYPVVLDREGRLMEIYRAMGLPTSIIIDAEGVIRVRHVGYLSAAQLEEYLQPLLP